MPSRTEPSASMIAFFEKRTRAHIALVAQNLRLLAQNSKHAEALAQRARTHDASKFGRHEREPYIWLTEYHRCRRSGLPFAYPDGVEARVKEAIEHHLTSNRHHPQYHASPDDMTEVDLIEMVCDWTAMAQEYEQDGSAKSWADKTVGIRVVFSEEKRRFIYETIERLDALNSRRSHA